MTFFTVISSQLAAPNGPHSSGYCIPDWISKVFLHSLSVRSIILNNYFVVAISHQLGEYLYPFQNLNISTALKTISHFQLVIEVEVFWGVLFRVKMTWIP